VDAVKHLRTLSDQITGEGDVALAVSLDIVNAFNSLSWKCVGEAMELHRLPAYLKEVLWDYFRGRGLQFRKRAELVYGRPMYCGVPQGSVLGPIIVEPRIRQGAPPGLPGDLLRR
jgi:hypothetical protein